MSERLVSAEFREPSGIVTLLPGIRQIRIVPSGQNGIFHLRVDHAPASLGLSPGLFGILAWDVEIGDDLVTGSLDAALILLIDCDSMLLESNKPPRHVTRSSHEAQADHAETWRDRPSMLGQT